MFSYPSQEYWEKNNHSQRSSDAVTPLTSGAATPELFHRDPTGHQANRMEEQLTLKLQQLAGRVSDSLTGGGGGGGDDEDGQRGEKRQGRKDRGEDDERPWRMEIDLDEGRTEEDEEMKDGLYRLIAQARLTYLSTDDDLDKDGHSEGEWEGDEEGNMEVEKTARLTSKLCQLENEVRANQFSSTEDELDRVGVMDEERKTEEEEEELAVKVCRVANQANATQFSSTEDELDRTDGGEEGEEAIEEENLWKRQTGCDDQAARLHDLARQISASPFSSTEDELDRVGGNEVEEGINEGGTEREEGAGNNVDRREPFGGLDVNLFDLRDEIKTESCDEEVEDVQQEKTESEGKKDCMKERVTDEDERMAKEHIRQEKVELLKEDMAEKANERRRAMELISSDERKAQRGNQPKKKCQEKPEGGEEQEEGKRGEESQDTTDSDEEDAEFEKIISSMLTMTLEDMQMEALKDVAADNGRSTSREPEEEEVQIEREGGFEETGRTKEESAVRGPGGTAAKQTGIDVIRETGGGDAAGRDEDERQEKDGDAQEEMHVNIKEPVQAKQTCERREMDEEEREDRTVRAEWTVEGGAAGGDYESKGRSESLEEEADDTERSASPPQDASLSPEEIKNVRRFIMNATLLFAA